MPYHRRSYFNAYDVLVGIRSVAAISNVSPAVVATEPIRGSVDASQGSSPYELVRQRG